MGLTLEHEHDGQSQSQSWASSMDAEGLRKGRAKANTAPSVSSLGLTCFVVTRSVPGPQVLPRDDSTTCPTLSLLHALLLLCPVY